MMSLFRRKRAAPEEPQAGPAPQIDPTPAEPRAEPAPMEPHAAPASVEPAPDGRDGAAAPEPATPAPPPYEPWAPGGASMDPIGLMPSIVPLDETCELERPIPPGMSDDHPLARPIARALSAVYDPEIPINIYELGLIYHVEIDAENNVHVLMTLTAPGCPVAGQMPGMVEHALVSQVEGIGDAEVELVWDPPWSPDLMSEAARLELGFM